jgi:hypothetical protein
VLIVDAEEQFLKLVKETVSTLARKGKKPREWKSDDGQVVRGWSVKRWDQEATTEGNPARGWWRETWGNGCTILSDRGEFWEYAFHGTDEANKSTELTSSLRRTPGAHLVGARGKPFSELTGMLERLPYL